MDYQSPMNDGWISRLTGVILERQKTGVQSMRALSLKCNFGPNYVNQIIKNGKQPGADRLATMLEEFDRETAFFILLGFRLRPGDLDVLEKMSKLSEPSRTSFLEILAQLKVDPDKLTPERGPMAEDPPDPE